jgi:hypothetical protein
MTTATVTPELTAALAALADAYRAHRDAATALTGTWQALRDPGQPWQQTLMRLHDQHNTLTGTAENLYGALTAAADEYRAAGSDRALADTLDGDSSLAGVAVTFDHLPSLLHLADRGWFYVVHYPDSADEVVYRVRELIEKQRRYIREALSPAS